MIKRALGCTVTCLAVVSLIVPASAQTDWHTKAFVPAFISTHHPAPRAGSTEWVLLQVARAAGVPFGFEWSRQPLPDETAVPTPADLSGMTIEQALNTVEQADPRYAWREQDGILVIRPRTAWADPHHFFNRPVGTLKIAGTNAQAMLWRISGWMYPDLQVPPASEQRPSTDAPFNVQVTEGTVLNVLDQTIKSAGDLYWCLSYGEPICGAPPRTQLTVLWLSMGRLNPPLVNVGAIGHRSLPPPWTGSPR